MTRDEFMTFFRDDESLNKLNDEDRIEIFSQILSGSSDFKKNLFDKIFLDYRVFNLEIIEVNNG